MAACPGIQWSLATYANAQEAAAGNNGIGAQGTRSLAAALDKGRERSSPASLQYQHPAFQHRRGRGGRARSRRASRRTRRSRAWTSATTESAMKVHCRSKNNSSHRPFFRAAAVCALADRLPARLRQRHRGGAGRTRGGIRARRGWTAWQVRQRVRLKTDSGSISHMGGRLWLSASKVNWSLSARRPRRRPLRSAACASLPAWPPSRESAGGRRAAVCARARCKSSSDSP